MEQNEGVIMKVYVTEYQRALLEGLVRDRIVTILDYPAFDRDSDELQNLYLLKTELYQAGT